MRQHVRRVIFGIMASAEDTRRQSMFIQTIAEVKTFPLLHLGTGAANTSRRERVVSIKRISEFEFEREFPVGWHNDTHEIKFTKEGIEIEYDLITWQTIDEIRAKLKDSGDGG